MLVSDLEAVNWLWPFMVLDPIYSRSNFGQPIGPVGRHYGQNLSGHKSGSVPIPLPQMAKASLLQQRLTILYIVLYNFNLREPSFPTLVRDRKAGLGWAGHLSRDISPLTHW